MTLDQLVTRGTILVEQNLICSLRNLEALTIGTSVFNQNTFNPHGKLLFLLKQQSESGGF